MTRDELALSGETNERGHGLRPGDYLGIWEEGVHPYGAPAACPFCKQPQDYTALWYNGPGSPPSYAFQCGNCGAQGPTSRGAGRGDHYGACMDAIKEWNRACDSDSHPDL